MEKKLENIFPIIGVEHDCILSAQGDITVVYQAELPEIFTLSDAEYEAFHHAWIKAIKVLPMFSILHKQDWYLRSVYTPVKTEKPSYLKTAADQHFNGREYLSHACYIALTKKPDGRKPSSSMFSSLLRRSIVPEQTLTPDALKQFLGSCGQFKRIMEDSGFVKLRRLSNDDLSSQSRNAGLIERYCYLSEHPESLMIKDIAFGDSIKVGDQHCQLYTLGDAADLPSLCGSRLNYDKYSTDKTKFSVGFASSLGQLLSCNHIYNQYVFINDARKTIQKLETKRLRLQSLSAYSRENMIARDATNDFLNEAIAEQRLPVKAHFNVLAWTEQPEEAKEIKNKISTAFAQMDIVAKLETAGAAQIFWAGIPGNSADFPENDSFDTFLEQATCFFNCEGSPRSVLPNQGIRFCDRLSSKPLFVDLYDSVREAGITSNMGTLLVGASGTGKSMLANAMLHTLYNQGAHCVTIDIGGSYRGLCSMLNGYYFTYQEHDPIKFNPFYLSAGEVLDTEKKESLKSLLIALWKQENDSFNRSEYVALSNALSGYYISLSANENIFPCFNTFYEYLLNEYQAVLKTHKVKDRDFDLDNFLYVLRPYYKEGEFDYLLNATENLDLLNQPFIVIELDNIAGHPVLFSVVTLLVTEMFISKMRKLKGARKVLTIDEAWKAIMNAGMAGFMQYAVKTFRKFNAIPFIISQEIDDMLSSPIIKEAIINNCDVKILLDMRKFMNKFDKVQDTLGLSEKAKAILLSVNKDEREVFIDLGGQVQKVYKNELCLQEYYAFTTEGKERVKVLDYAEKYGSMEKGIDMIVKELSRA